MKNVLFGVWLLAAAAAFSSARAETMVLQWEDSGTYQGTYFANVGETTSNYNQGSRVTVFGDPAVDVLGSTKLSAGLLTFNDYNGLGVGGIPVGQTIDSAVLSLHISNLTLHSGYGSPFMLYVAPIVSLDSLSITSNAWLGATVPTINEGQAIGFDLGSSAIGDTIQIEIGSIIQSWYDGSQTNYGLAIYTSPMKASNEYYFMAQFETANNGYVTGLIPPSLTINFSAIPEPSTYVLLGIGVLLAGLRYWRKRA
jgi:hypothetical protein